MYVSFNTMVIVIMFNILLYYVLILCFFLRIQCHHVNLNEETKTKGGVVIDTDLKSLSACILENYAFSYYSIFMGINFKET